MKKNQALLFFFVIFLANLAYSQTSSYEDVAIWSTNKVYKKVLKLNKVNIRNQDLIRPGDSIFLPVLPDMSFLQHVESGWEPRQVDKLIWVVDRHESIWNISSRYYESYVRMRSGDGRDLLDDNPIFVQIWCSLHMFTL